MSRKTKGEIESSESYLMESRRESHMKRVGQFALAIVFCYWGATTGWGRKIAPRSEAWSPINMARPSRTPRLS